MFLLGCPVLQSPKYGSINATLSAPEAGDTVTFSCNSGYNLFGTATRICLQSSVWSGTGVICQGMLCIK